MADAVDEGRSAFERDDWRAAYELLGQADRDGAVEARDLLWLGTAAHLVGEDADSHDALERAHHAFVEDGAVGEAARCAFWLGMALMDRGETARGGGWLARAARLVDDEPDLPERGYLMIPHGLQQMFGGDAPGAHATFTQATAIGERFGDADLVALGRLGIGQSLIGLGRAAEGLALLDEVMVSVEAGDVSPVPAGIIYCAVIEGCHRVFDVRRAQEWTSALTRWCAAHPDLVPYRGQCLIHRSQILLFHGDWPEALDAADSACRQFAHPPGRAAVGEAHYQRGEVLRLTGDLDAAEEAYREAASWGRVPQPGLALLRVAQGRVDAAVAAIRRAVEESGDPAARAAMLAAHAEIALAADDVAAARAAADELAAVAASLHAEPLQAVAAHVSGAVLMVEGHTTRALRSLRAASTAWSDLDAPYEAARARVLIGLACRELGDVDGADMELEAARAGFADLGASPEVSRVEELLRSGDDAVAHVMSQREIQVLRLVARGKSNRAIADELVISEHTVARHVQNIFAKLGVSSRTAAAGYAFEHGLA